MHLIDAANLKLLLTDSQFSEIALIQTIMNSLMTRIQAQAASFNLIQGQILHMASALQMVLHLHFHLPFHDACPRCYC